MADQIVITEKTSQAKDIRAAVGSRYGDILPAEGHLFDLLEGIADNRLPEPNFADGVKNQRVLEAIEKSAKSRKWISVPVRGAKPPEEP